MFLVFQTKLLEQLHHAGAGGQPALVPCSCCSFTVLRFVTTTPVLCRSAAPLRERARRRASLQAGGPVHDTPRRRCSLLPPRSAARGPALPETPSTPSHNP